MGVSSIDGAVELLKDEFDVDPDQIRSALALLVDDQGFSLPAAIVKFRSDSKNRKRAETAEYIGRVIGKSGKRMQELGGGRASPVASVVWLMMEGGAPILSETAFWGDERADIPKSLERGEVYKFNAKKEGPKLSRLADLTKIVDDSIPTVFSLKDYGVTYAKLSRIQEYLKSSDLFWGYVGRVIKAKNSDETRGFEIGDIDAGPFTVWGTGGDYEEADPDEDKVLQALAEAMEVVVYGYVSTNKKTGEPRINARGIWVVE